MCHLMLQCVSYTTSALCSINYQCFAWLFTSTLSYLRCRRLIDVSVYKMNGEIEKKQYDFVYFIFFMVFNCLHGQAPQYLVELCQPVAGVASRQHLRSAAQRLLVVPRHQLSSYGRRAFCVAGPSVSNSLPDNFRNPIIGWNSFRQSLKTFLFATYWSIQRIKGFMTMRYINRLFTYLLTYLLKGTICIMALQPLFLHCCHLANKVVYILCTCIFIAQN